MYMYVQDIDCCYGLDCSLWIVPFRYPTDLQCEFGVSCDDNSTCYDDSSRCDGIKDCDDASDEAHCPES